MTYGLRTTAEQLCQTDFETGDRSLLYLTPGIFEQKYRNSQCVKISETGGWKVFLLLFVLISNFIVGHLKRLLHILPYLNTLCQTQFCKTLHCICAQRICVFVCPLIPNLNICPTSPAHNIGPVARPVH